MGIANELASALERAISGDIPELIARGTAESPTILNKALAQQKARGGLPAGVGLRPAPTANVIPLEMQKLTRTTAVSVPYTLADAVGNVRHLVESVFRAQPGMPNDINAMAIHTRAMVNAANDQAELLVRKNVTDHLKSGPEDLALLSDYMKLMNDASQMASTARAFPERTVLGPSGENPLQVEAALAAMKPLIAANPNVQVAHQGARTLLDNMFDDMVARGYITPDRYRQNYTPQEQLGQVADALVKLRGSTKVAGTVLSAMQRRRGIAGPAETNIIKQLTDTLADYNRKIAEDDAVVSWLKDPTLNFTDKFKPGEIIPTGITRWSAKPGMPGYGIRTAESEVLQGAIDGLHEGATITTGHGFIIPTPLATMLDNFKPQRGSDVDTRLYKFGQMIARFLTIYNPPGRVLNFMQDNIVAMMGLPDEPSRALGIMQFTPLALREAFKGAFGKPSIFYDRLRQSGAASSMIVSDVGGAPMAQDFTRFSQQQPLKLSERLKQFSQALESAPRIAAGEEALARTGSLKEYGRVARAITLQYGSGAPAVARSAPMRMMAPFIQWMGLQSTRLFDLATTPGSRARTITAIAGVPTLVYMWNVHNDAFKAAYNAIPMYDKNGISVIVPDPTKDEPLLDSRGQVVRVPLRMWVPEQVLQNVGLGNLPDKLMRAVKGRVTPSEMITNAANEALKGTAQQLVIPNIAISTLTGKDLRSGKDLELADRIANIFPQTRLAKKIYDTAREGNIGQAAAQAALGLVGISTGTEAHKGTKLLDADLRDAMQERSDAVKSIHYWMREKKLAKAQDARNKELDAVAKIRRIKAAIAKEQTDATTP